MLLFHLEQTRNEIKRIDVFTFLSVLSVLSAVCYADCEVSEGCVRR